jgi:hypothetical protein
MATLAPEPSRSDNSITALLLQLSAGNRDVEALLIPQVYGELRRLAARYMRHERGEHTLQPTALVNEAYVHMVKQPRAPGKAAPISTPQPPSSCVTSSSITLAEG